MANAALVKDMLDNAVHIGYKRQYWSPKMRDYIFTTQNNIHVFDLFKTADKLEEVKTLLADLTAKGKEILFVGTKVQAADIARTLALETGHHYVNSKWVPGLLTNFTTLKRRIATYVKLEKDLETGALDMLTKKERSEAMKSLEKLRKAYEGLKEMKKTPDIVFVIDGHYENLALTEARSLRIPSVALLGSTGDIDACTHFVPCNVNSIKAIQFIADFLKPVLTRQKKTFAEAPKTSREGGFRPRTNNNNDRRAPRAKTEEAPKAE